MNENGTKRRDWVKNAAIIFLVVLLLLTFFSNTIMNYSLPEVAAQYIQSGSITAKIRGTGTVESGDPYKIELAQTRVVESVNVKVGDKVQKGDTLFVLEDAESDDLKAKEEELDAAILEFEKSILSGTISNNVISNVQSGSISSVSQYQNRILAAEAEVEKWQNEVNAIQVKIDQLDTEINRQGYYGDPDTTNEAKAVFNAQNNYDKKNEELTLAKGNLDTMTKELNNALQVIKSYENGLDNSVSGGDNYQDAITKRDKLPPLIAEAQNQVTNLQAEAYALKLEVDKAQASLDNKKGNKGNIASLSVQKENWNLEMKDKQAKLKTAEDNKTQLLADIASELSLDAQSDLINKKREAVAEQRAKEIGAVIEAPISGTVTALSITAGEKTGAEKVLATMQPEGKGYSMSFSVTNEQAKRLSVGDMAEIVNSWMYDEVTVKLAGMKPDPTDPGKKKLLTFDVTGELTAGQSLNVSVGQKSANYDMIVPNSAIREDNNGKFILTVVPKSSPLGNRYIATRVDVEVIASDDTQSAITGGLYGSEFVITTSTKPVEAGKQVRLADN